MTDQAREAWVDVAKKLAGICSHGVLAIGRGWEGEHHVSRTYPEHVEHVRKVFAEENQQFVKIPD